MSNIFSFIIFEIYKFLINIIHISQTIILYMEPGKRQKNTLVILSMIFF